MNTTIYCNIAGFQVKINNNSVKTDNSSLQIELVKRLIDCKAASLIGESALPMFFNKYLRKYQISNVEFIQEKTPSNNIPLFENWKICKNIAA
jgi:hypothetical protein